MPAPRPSAAKRQFRHGGTVLTRHQHAAAYLAVVLSGGYEEAGDRGCFRVAAGDVILHTPFEAHINRYNLTGAEVLDLPLTVLPSANLPTVATLHDADLPVRLAHSDPSAAAAWVLAHMLPADRLQRDWPHRLAAALEHDPYLRLDAWAAGHRLSAAAVTRGFQKVFGATPSAFRLQQRARHAWRLAHSSTAQLSEIALTAGFADQAHMTRAVHSLTGHPPGAWRRQQLAQIRNTV